MIPDTTLALNAVCIGQGTCTSMSAEAFPTMAHPGFAEVTNCPLMVKKRIIGTKTRAFETIFCRGLCVNIIKLTLNKKGCVGL